MEGCVRGAMAVEKLSRPVKFQGVTYALVQEPVVSVTVYTCE